MKYIPHKILFSWPIILLFISGCTTFKIVDLKPEALISSTGHPTTTIAGVETIQVTNGEYRDAERWQQGLAEALRDEGAFKSVAHSYIDKENIDILIRGEVEGKFRHQGAKNFFTWWPGPLIFAHNWRGTRYIYDAHANIEVIDASTGKLLGEYQAESSHELIHKSANPGPMIAALTIIPGVIKGAMSVSPRKKYRTLMYKVAYPNLWKKMAIKIDEDQSKRNFQRVVLLKGQCGLRLDATPEVGMVWSEFISCQTRNYRLSGQKSMESGVVSVYIRNDRYYRIHVSKDDRIVSWFVKKQTE